MDDQSKTNQPESENQTQEQNSGNKGGTDAPGQTDESTSGNQ